MNEMVDIRDVDEENDEEDWANDMIQLARS